MDLHNMIFIKYQWIDNTCRINMHIFIIILYININIKIKDTGK